MQRFRTEKTLDSLAFLPERGKAREEYYEPSKKEMFGLHKRTRRVKKGEMVTLPNGSYGK